MLKNVFLLLSMMLTSSIALADYDYKYEADLFGQYYDRDFSKYDDARDFCEKRASWHGLDFSKLKNVCFINKYQITDKYGYKRDRFESTFKVFLLRFSEKSSERLLFAIMDYQYEQVFRGFPLQFLTVFDSERRK